MQFIQLSLETFSGLRRCFVCVFLLFCFLCFFSLDFLFVSLCYLFIFC